jgi:uncharacterized RDD family membrane protein YckC
VNELTRKGTSVMNECPVCHKTLVTPTPICPWCNSLIADPSAGKVGSAGKRLLAYILDYGAGLLAYLGRDDTVILMAVAVIIIGQMVLWTKGQSIGKALTHLKVYRVTGQPATFGTMFVREVFAKILSGLVFGLGYLVILWDPTHRGWHDKLCGTVVIDMATAVQLAAHTAA